MSVKPPTTTPPQLPLPAPALPDDPLPEADKVSTAPSGCIGKTIEWFIECEERSTAAKVCMYILAFFATVVLCASIVLMPLFVALYKEYEAQHSDGAVAAQSQKIKTKFEEAVDDLEKDLKTLRKVNSRLDHQYGATKVQLQKLKQAHVQLNASYNQAVGQLNLLGVSKDQLKRKDQTVIATVLRENAELRKKAGLPSIEKDSTDEKRIEPEDVADDTAQTTLTQGEAANILKKISEEQLKRFKETGELPDVLQRLSPAYNPSIALDGIDDPAQS